MAIRIVVIDRYNLGKVALADLFKGNKDPGEKLIERYTVDNLQAQSWMSINRQYVYIKYNDKDRHPVTLEKLDKE